MRAAVRVRRRVRQKSVPVWPNSQQNLMDLEPIGIRLFSSQSERSSTIFGHSYSKITRNAGIAVLASRLRRPFRTGRPSTVVLLDFGTNQRRTGTLQYGECCMPQFSDLQRLLKSQSRRIETRFDRNSGEESLVIDERSGRSSVRVVEEKLQRLIRFRSVAVASGEADY